METLYLKARSTLEISKYLADILEECDGKQYPPMNRAGTIRAINDILQERSDRTIHDMLDEVKRAGGVYYPERIEGLEQDIKDYLLQLSARLHPYEKSSDIKFQYDTAGIYPLRPLKVITQSIFDEAAEAGFPKDFFRESYFDGVTIYCLPDFANCNFSYFSGCKFAVCRIHGTEFANATFSSSEFYSADIEQVSFYRASFYHTHINDSTLRRISFQEALLRSCNTMDCKMHNIKYQFARLDDCRFDNVQASEIHALHTAHITQSGATQEECEYNRKAIYRALSPQEPKPPNMQKHKGAR